MEDVAGELRSITRHDERASREERLLFDPLRADLPTTSPVVLKLLTRWPGHRQLADADDEEIEAFARPAKHAWPDGFVARVTDALAAEQLPVQDYLVRAKETSTDRHPAPSTTPGPESLETTNERATAFYGFENLQSPGVPTN